MARKTPSASEKERQESEQVKTASNLTEISRKLLGLADDSYKIKSSIELQTSKFDEIINRNLDVSKGIAGGNILDFAQNVRLGEMRTPRGGLSPANTQDLRKMLSTSSGDIYAYFQEVYQNKYIEIADLKFIAKFIPALGEAVNVLLDAICNSDDLSGTISRTIQTDAGMSDTDRNQLISTIETIEKDQKLQKRLKNIVYKTALVSGKYYVYAISYKELFEQYSQERAESMSMLNLANIGNFASAQSKVRKPKSNNGLKVANESTYTIDGSKNTFGIGRGEIAFENVTDAINVNELKAIVEEAKSDYLLGSETPREKNEIQKALAQFESELSTRASEVKIIHSGIPEIVLDDLPAMEAYTKNEGTQKVNDPAYKGVFDKYFGSTPIDMEAGVVSSGSSNFTTGYKAEKGFNVSGTYIRYIDPKNIIPVRLMGEVIGYYYISSAKRVKRVTASTSNTNANILGTDAFSGAFNIGALNDQRKISIVDSIIDSISNSICTNFSKKFVTKNIEFKKAIADCITYNGFLDNEYHVQFIDAKNVIEFTINEDEEGNGESVLANSLFPAKLLLSLLTARILNYLNLTGDKQIAHIAKGPIDVHMGRQTQRLIRNIQETKITFSDLLSTNLVFNKFSRNRNVLLPKSRDGTNLVEFEVMDGQNIDMNPEYENKLEQMAIMGTGVPSVIMEYIGQTEFARGFETGNIKFASNVSSKQADLEEPTTELYNRLVANSPLNDEVKSRVLNRFTVKLNRPKTLVVSNNNEYLNTLQQFLQMVGNVYYGENPSDQKMVSAKEQFVRLSAREYAPYIDWNAFDKIKEQADIDSANPENKSDEESGGGSGY